MNTITWIILVIVVIGIIWYAMSKKKKGTESSGRPEGPTAPPETPSM